MTKSIALTLVLAMVYVALVAVPSPTNAGVFSSTISKAAARKAAARQSVAKVNAGQYRKSPAFTREETAAMQRQLHELDRNVVARIEARYGQYIPSGKLQASAKCDTCFLDRRAYDEHLRRADPTLSAADRQAILGYFKDGKMYVNKGERQIQATVSHERLHQLSHGEFRTRAGRSIDEGLTEHFSGRIYRDLSLKDAPVVYLREQRLIQMMQARVGEEQLATAYFSGNTRTLQRSLDDQLGRGAFDKVVRRAERGDFAGAERILLNGL